MTTATQVGPVLLAAGARTDVGKTRKHNEDSFLCEAPVFLVADGMGGYSAGEVASALVVEEFRSLVQADAVDARGLREALDRAASAVAALDGVAEGAGTTVAGVSLAAVDGVGYWVVINVGDSRTYRLHRGQLEQISVDHSVVQELVDSGELTAEQARVDSRRNMVTRAVGAGAPGEPDFWMVPVERGDRIVICSDGLSGEVPDPEIEQLLVDTQDPQAAADALVERALDSGGRDNVTVVVVDAVEVADAAHEGPDDDTVPRETSEVG